MYALNQKGHNINRQMLYYPYMGKQHQTIWSPYLFYPSCFLALFLSGKEVWGYGQVGLRMQGRGFEKKTLASDMMRVTCTPYKPTRPHIPDSWFLSHPTLPLRLLLIEQASFFSLILRSFQLFAEYCNWNVLCPIFHVGSWNHCSGLNFDLTFWENPIWSSYVKWHLHIHAHNLCSLFSSITFSIALTVL